MRPNVYLDLDGVMADFDRGYLERFGCPPRDHDDDTLWRNIDGCDDFFPSLQLVDGARQFYDWVTKAHCLNVMILTACPRTNYPKAARHKIDWVRNNLCREVMVLPVMGGVNKPLFMHRPGDVLIDDYRRNVKAWSEAGGVGILHRNWHDTSAALEEVLER